MVPFKGVYEGYVGVRQAYIGLRVFSNLLALWQRIPEKKYRSTGCGDLNSWPGESFVVLAAILTSLLLSRLKVDVQEEFQQKQNLFEKAKYEQIVSLVALCKAGMVVASQLSCTNPPESIIVARECAQKV